MTKVTKSLNCNPEVESRLINPESPWRIDDPSVPFVESRVYKSDGSFYVTKCGDDTIDMTNQSYITSEVSVNHDIFFHSFEHASYKHFCRFMKHRYEEILAEISEMTIAGYNKDRIATYYLDYFELSAQTLYNADKMNHREFLWAMTRMNDLWKRLVRVCEFEVYDEDDSLVD